jgi:hypothetical protein
MGREPGIFRRIIFISPPTRRTGMRRAARRGSLSVMSSMARRARSEVA